MLSDKERKKIIKLIQEGDTDYSISKKTGHSVNTIGRIREKFEETEKKQILTEKPRSNRPIDITREYIAQVDTFIQSKKLSDKEKKSWRNG